MLASSNVLKPTCWVWTPATPSVECQPSYPCPAACAPIEQCQCSRSFTAVFSAAGSPGIDDVPTVAEVLTQAIHYHRSGDDVRAEQLYQLVLQADPKNADVHHLRGL